MNHTKKELGTIQAVLGRLNTERLPRALWLQSKVRRGERLDYHDIVFLRHVLDDTNDLRALVARNAEYQTLTLRLIALYSDIVSKGLQNEKTT